jgi:phosphomannomutase
MITLETPTTYPQPTQQIGSSTILVAGLAGAEHLTHALKDQGLDCRYMYLTLESDARAGFTYQKLTPALSQAQQLGLQMVIIADPQQHRLSVGIRKQSEAPFQLLSVHQLAVVLAYTLAEQAGEQGFACLRSVVITEMLETMLLKKGYACKADILEGETLQTAGEALLAASQASEVLVVTEKGEFWSNKGFTYLVKQLVELQQALVRKEQSLFDKMVDLYYTYGYHKEKLLAVTLVEKYQEAHYHGLMEYFRTTKTAELVSFTIKEIIDYKSSKQINLFTKKQIKLTNRPADILKVVFEEGISLTFVPAPERISLYLSASGKIMNWEAYLQLSRSFEQRFMKLLEILNKI